MNCTITVEWGEMTPEDREGLLAFLHSEEFKKMPLWPRRLPILIPDEQEWQEWLQSTNFKETPRWVCWLTALNPEERVFDAPKDTGRFGESECHIFLELLRILAQSFPSFDAGVHGHAGSGIRKFDLGGTFTAVIRNGELREDFTGIP